MQRSAVEALAADPGPDNLWPLLEVRHTVPAEDTHLLYAVRVALRNHFLNKAAWGVFQGEFPQPRDEQAVDLRFIDAIY